LGLVVLFGGAIPAKARAVEAQGDASPLADDATMIALAVALSCADAPDNKAGPPAEPSTPKPTGPELELVADVSAKSLRFDEVPKVNVVFKGNGSQRTVWKSERVNLPARPEKGVTYKDVRVKLTITSDIEELASLLREAKRASRGVRIEPVAAAGPATPAAPTAPAAHAAPAAPAPHVAPPAAPAAAAPAGPTAAKK
jgi:hypothetical protein